MWNLSLNETIVWNKHQTYQNHVQGNSTLSASLIHQYLGSFCNFSTYSFYLTHHKPFSLVTFFNLLDLAKLLMVLVDFTHTHTHTQTECTPEELATVMRHFGRSWQNLEKPIGCSSFKNSKWSSFKLTSNSCFCLCSLHRCVYGLQFLWIYILFSQVHILEYSSFG